MSREYNAEQKAWVERFKARTGFDPDMDSFKSGEKSFFEAARDSCTWWEDHSNDAMLAITCNIPGWDEAFDKIMQARVQP